MFLNNSTYSTFQLFLIIAVIHLNPAFGVPKQMLKSSKLPIAFDYMIYLQAGQQDWFYQEVESGAVFRIELEVVKGSFGKVGFGINDPNGKTLVPFDWRKNASYVTKSADEGYYAFVIDNKASMFASATVNVYISCYYSDQDWINRMTSILTSNDVDIDEFDESSKNISEKLGRIQTKIGLMRTYLILSRKLERVDMSILMGNNNMVTTWSILQCIVIILSAGLHVYFIRQFFRTPSIKNNVKLGMFGIRNSSNYL